MSVETYKNTFRDLEKTLRGVGPAWVHSLRKRGLEKFLKHGFPTLRNEEWRFTRIKPLADAVFVPTTPSKTGGEAAGGKAAGAVAAVGADEIVARTFGDEGCRRLVFVDGRFAPELSRIDDLPEGILLGSLNEALQTHPDLVRPYLGELADVESQPFAALNTAFLHDGALVYLLGNVSLQDPIHVVFVSGGNEGTVSYPRTLVVAGRNSHATVIESYFGLKDGAYFTNAVSEIVCGENAEVRHCKLQRESESAFHVAMQHARIEHNGRFATENISVGGGLVRNDVVSILDGSGIDCRVDGLYLGTRRQHIDNHTFIRHAKPHCYSLEVYKGILSGKARGVFNGKIYVDPGAQKTDSKQSNNCILLSEDARVNTNPQLEIFADDVRCTHGATVGQLDEDAVFYLRSRGIPTGLSRDMLVYAFAAEVIERINVGRVRERLQHDLYDWLAGNPNG